MADEGNQARQDLEQLLKEYRNVEANRKAYAEESVQVIRKQEARLTKMKKEKEKLKSEIELESRFQPKSGENSKLAQLKQQDAEFKQRIENEKQNHIEMNKRIRYMKDKILEQRKTMGGVNASHDNQRMIQKQIRILENRLDKALVKFNEGLSHNKELRETIDNLRRERVVFDDIYRKLEKELIDKKRQMADVIEKSNQAYEERDSWQLEVASLQQQASKEAVEHEAAMSELNKVLAEQVDLLEQQEEEEEEDQEELTRRNKDGLSLAQDKAAVQFSMDKVKSYKQAFDRILSAMGMEPTEEGDEEEIGRIEELVTKFIKTEDQNFSLFNYVNEQNNEIERLTDQNNTLDQEIVKYTNETGDDSGQHQQLLKELETKLHNTEAMAERYEMRYNEAQKTVNSLKIAIQSLFEKIDCSSSGMAEMLADSIVTEANMMQFLGMIEQRTNEIIQDKVLGLQPSSPRASEAHPSPRPMSGVRPMTGASVQSNGGMMLGTGPAAPMGTDAIRVSPPSLDDYSSESDGDDMDDSDTRPLTLKELKDKTLKNIAMKNTQQKGRRRRKN
eukprot:TRINITY_DN2133_c0_g3_i1.p1 TRINITY_DN2133_c0_g3~~TRINITY_DN2133_c0_g3_i1.p1  ORF type:complete len:560 (-),score=210.49 TRINITY_DN2133_c0_g3_i1:68-1747(-)